MPRPDPEDDDLGLGNEPQERVGPDGCVAGPSTCRIAPAEMKRPPDQCRFGTQEHLMDALHMEPTVMVMSPEDGLPVPAGESDQLAEVPVQTIENFICMGDDREYVETFCDEYGTLELQPKELRQAAPHDRSRVRAEGSRAGYILVTRERFDDKGQERTRITYAPERVTRLYGQSYVVLTMEDQLAWGDEPIYGVRPAEAFSDGRKDGDKILMPVRPKRRPCGHYKRALFGVTESPGNKISFPFCTALRSNGGAYMDLSGEAVYACQFRSPPDLISEERLLLKPERDKVMMDEGPTDTRSFFDRFQKTPQEKAREAAAAAAAVPSGGDSHFKSDPDA